MKVAQVLGALASAAAVGACGGNVVLGSPADGGHVGQGSDGGHVVLGSDGGHVVPGDATVQGQPDAGQGVKDSGPVKDAGYAFTYVDAGVYFGDGSFFSDTGVTTVDASGHSGFDAAGIDASSGCGQLAACCATLSGSTQSLCQSVASSGNAANCTSEVSLLQGDGNCTGVTVLADHVQSLPVLLVTDGTTLFWITGTMSTELFAMPVGGGAVRTLLTAFTPDELPLLTVDAVNVYVQNGQSLVRIPKNGSPATLVNEPGAAVMAATTLGSTAYWLEEAQATNSNALVLKSAALLGGSVSELETIGPPQPSGVLALTAASLFVGGGGGSVSYGPLGSSGALSSTAAESCWWLTSDTTAVYCSQGGGGEASNLRIANDGTVSALGPAVVSGGNFLSPIVFDDTYVYWVDNVPAGTIMKAPKAGGGPATVLAYDTSPTAIAVDAHSVYWGDQAGYIKSIPK